MQLQVLSLYKYIYNIDNIIIYFIENMIQYSININMPDIAAIIIISIELYQAGVH